ncbi:MAG: hypothetical protein ACYC5Y_02400 [Symbiobacteriia bacterium]
MDGIPYDVMVDGVSLVFAIAGLIWAVRFAGLLSDRHAPMLAIALGVVFVGGLYLVPGVLTPIVRGIAAGTVASGGYAGVKKMVTNSPNPMAADAPAGASPTRSLVPPPVRADHDPNLQP